jgi:hypothetical protein
VNFRRKAIHILTAVALCAGGQSLMAKTAYSPLPVLSAAQAYLSQFCFNEQSLNDKTENTEVFADIMKVNLAPPYRPETNQSFPLKTYLVPASDVVVLNTRADIPDHRLRVETVGGAKYLFFVHPVSLPAFEPYLKKFPAEDSYFATPLSSFRSVLAWSAIPDGVTGRSEVMNLKVSLDTEIGQANRMLERTQIERATATSLVLRGADKEAFAKEGIHFIDEPFSIYLKDFQYGYTWRELPPPNTVPMFSLYANGKKGKSMFAKMLEASQEDARSFVRRNIIVPMVHHMFVLASREGMVCEPHEQNTLIEIRDGQLTGNFYYRDLAGCNMNEKMRVLAGKDMKFIPSTFIARSFAIERADLIVKLRDYLVDSNFHAMRKAARSVTSSITKAWVDQATLDAVRVEIKELTGSEVTTWIGAHRAITAWTGPAACELMLKAKTPRSAQ